MILLDKYADPFPIKWTNIKRQVSNLIFLIQFFGGYLKKKKHVQPCFADDAMISS